jgi:hypothetical protein
MYLFSDVNNAYEMVLFVEGNIIAVTMHVALKVRNAAS